MSRVPELTCPATRAGLGEQSSLSSAARPGPAPYASVSPAVADHALHVTVPALERRVAELEALVGELRGRLALLAETGLAAEGDEW